MCLEMANESAVKVFVWLEYEACEDESEEEIRKTVKGNIESSLGCKVCDVGVLQRKQNEKHEMRKAESDADCADCLCRCCARSVYNDAYNHIVDEDGEYCEGCNACSGYVIETEEDCPRGNPLFDENE